ncbi:MAG: hypothetical protein ACO3EE_06405 [Flavobacteriales bacterium]
MVGSKTYSITAILLFVFSFSVKAQEEFSSEYVEYRSYQLYLNNDWKALILLGDSALDNNVDYYYLRIRLGIAHYELKQYFSAENHFVKALEFNSFEDLPKEYLYYCYVFTQRFEESRRVAKEFSASLQSKIGFDKLTAVDFVSVGGGKKITTIVDVPDANVFDASMGHYLFNRVYFTHSYFHYLQGDDIWNVKQKQYFVKMNVPLKNNWLLSGSFHFVQRNTTVNLTAPVNGLMKNKVSTQSVLGYNYVESFTASKYFRNHEFALGSTAMWLDSAFQFQHDLTYAYYPFSNTKFSIGAKAYLISQQNYSKLNFAALPFLNFRPSNRVNLFASYLYNEVDNIAEWNGALINNSPDITTGRLSLTATLALSPKWDLSATYQNETKDARYTSNYSFNSMFFSLKFKP